MASFVDIPNLANNNDAIVPVLPNPALQCIIIFFSFFKKFSRSERSKFNFKSEFLVGILKSLIGKCNQTKLF
jgi:hypothetical protein